MALMRRCRKLRCLRCRSRRCGWRSRAHVVTGMATRGTCRRRDLVVQLSPVARLDLLPGLVVGECRLVSEVSRRCLGIGRVSLLRDNEGWQAQRQHGRQPTAVRFHGSKTSESPTLGGRPIPMRWPHGPIRPPAEAVLGQMLRGGLSWPPERKLGAGAPRSGNSAPAGRRKSAMVGTVYCNGALEQQDAHRLH